MALDTSTRRSCCFGPMPHLGRVRDGVSWRLPKTQHPTTPTTWTSARLSLSFPSLPSLLQNHLFCCPFVGSSASPLHRFSFVPQPRIYDLLNLPALPWQDHRDEQETQARTRLGRRTVVFEETVRFRARENTREGLEETQATLRSADFAGLILLPSSEPLQPPCRWQRRASTTKGSKRCRRQQPSHPHCRWQGRGSSTQAPEQCR
ncbi:uncharacterized protein EI97DRAFT_499435 [Westerdykella ornata]|uniref:Uncharacterized protein n=1 Tax=Westerdykella ornata TaxID=318751 RepID=A0A6A6JRJ8_WESOR|nr:uncharacterized protein EI97DRAFT_499435 [Westerdykella ornata]KAF2278894.1 hypothetical protein EI97DRAFT_499435 [Westerdykella ornata]